MACEEGRRKEKGKRAEKDGTLKKVDDWRYRRGKKVSKEERGQREAFLAKKKKKAIAVAVR